MSIKIPVKTSGIEIAKKFVSSKSDKNTEYFMWRPMYVYDGISLNSS